MPKSIKSLAFRYGLAILIFAVILGFALLSRQYSIRISFTIPILVGMVAASWFGGRGPGILLSVLIMGATYFLRPSSPEASIAGLLFGYFSALVLLVFLVVLISGRKRVQTRLKEQNELISDALDREKAARREAEAANRLKDEFLATVSHELRTPLNAILGWAAMLRESDVDGIEAKKALSVIERNAKMQNELIGDILDVSRIVTGKLRIESKPVDLVPIIRAAVETAFPAAEAKRIRIETTFAANDPVIMGDADRLQQVFWNLLSNAIKFTRPGGRVEIDLTSDGTNAEVRFRDTGVGIDQEFLPVVFDRFRQVDSSFKRAHGGLGLGLAIVRHLTELHGGTVGAESEGEGLGATFSVKFPLFHSAAGLVERNRQPEELPDLAGLRVLVVDDHADTLEMFCAALEKSGAVARGADSCPSAMETFREWRPDVLVSDLGMPGEDGFDLISRIRALGSGNGGDVPAAAVTAYARQEDRERALSAGFQAHISKPVDTAALINAVADLAKRRATAPA